MSKVTIIYKSGAKVVCESDGNLKVTLGTMDGEIRKVEWGKLEPYPLFVGINDIAAIWEGKA